MCVLWLQLVLLGQGHVLLEFLPFSVVLGLFSIVGFNMYMCFRKYLVYGDTEYSLKNVSLEEKDL